MNPVIWTQNNGGSFLLWFEYSTNFMVRFNTSPIIFVLIEK